MPQVRLLIILAAGAVTASVIEEILGREAFIRLIAHLLGAIVVLAISRGLHATASPISATVDFLVRSAHRREILAFIVFSAVSASIVESVVNPHVLLYFAVHLWGLILGASLAGWSRVGLPAP